MNNFECITYAEAGGMWHKCYDNVNLHQPYRLFTVGNLKWDLRRNREYLASKSEITDHLKKCLDTLRKKISLEVRFETSLIV